MSGRPRGHYRTSEHVACPTCGAPIGTPCITVRAHPIRLSWPGHPTYPPHQARRRAAARTPPPARHTAPAHLGSETR